MRPVAWKHTNNGPHIQAVSFWKDYAVSHGEHYYSLYYRAHGVRVDPFAGISSGYLLGIFKSLLAAKQTAQAHHADLDRTIVVNPTAKKRKTSP